MDDRTRKGKEIIDDDKELSVRWLERKWQKAENWEFTSDWARLDPMTLEPSSIDDALDFDMPPADGDEEAEQASIPGNILGITGNKWDCFLDDALDFDMDFDMPPADGDEEAEQASIPGNILGITGNNGDCFLELQEANNIFKAAYKKIMTIAFEAHTWIEASPALGSLEEILQMFGSLPSPGMRVDLSTESAVVPISPNVLVSIMLDVDIWASTLSHIVYRGSGNVPASLWPQLSNTDKAIKKILMVNAKFQLPTPFIQARKFCFLRCLREIVPDIWAIIDVSTDYFPHTSDMTSEQKCWRKPSGMIVRSRDNDSEVIWVENVEVPEFQLQDSIYSGLINSNMVFSAKHWISTLIWSLKRSNSRFINVQMQIDRKDHNHLRNHLLNLTNSMKVVYLDIVNETPDERKWVTLSNQDVRILRSVTADHDDMLGSNNYMAVTSFRVQAKPLTVFDFLVKKNMKLQWPSLLNFEEPEELIKSVSCDGSNCITLHRTLVFLNERLEGLEYLLQEASNDGFCSFIISAPMTQLDVNTALFLGKWRDPILQPSGFAILPDCSNGLYSDASLVTIAMQQRNVLQTDQVIEYMQSLVNSIIEEICEAVSSEHIASN